MDFDHQTDSFPPASSALVKKPLNKADGGGHQQLVSTSAHPGGVENDLTGRWMRS